MPKNPGKKAKAAKSAPAEPSFDQELQTIWDQKDESPTSRLLDASQLWASDECQEDFFVKVKPFLDKFDSKKGASEAVAEDELIALYDEYVSKSEPALLEEVKELRSAGVLSKVEARALKEMSSAERKRLLFVRILVIAMEAEEDGDDIGSDGDEAADGEGDVGGLDIDEAFIAALTEEECAEKPQPEDGAEESVATTGDLVSWLCGLPTAELREMSEARGLESAGETTTARLPLEAVVEKLSGIPTFAVMHDTPTGKKFVPMLFKDDDQDEGVTSCAFFADPNEAKNTLLQAKSQHPDMNLAIGVMPLGKAFALCAGWAEAKSQRTPFTLRAAQPAAKQMRPILKKQLEVINLPSFWSFPVFLCEELQSPACLPVFLTREGLMETWAGTGKGTAAPANVTVTDLRVIVSEMQKGFKETGCDWSIVRFLGSEEGWSAIKDQVEGESGAPGGVSKGGGEAPAGEQRAGPADPDAEPPKLE